MMYNTFIVIGDTHGNYKYIAYKIKSTQIKDTTLFHVGDFGVGYESRESDDVRQLLELNEVLKEYNCHLYVIRGNHDKPTFFDGSYNYSNLHLMPDYSIVEVNGDKVLMVGGAISVDRKDSLRNMTIMASKYNKAVELYWYDESFVLNETKLKEIKGVRYVITHSSPSFVFPINDQSNVYDSHGPFVQGYVDRGDDKLKNDLNKERNDITRMWEILEGENFIDKWFYGHFHQSRRQLVGATEFILLKPDEFYNVIQ